MINFKNVLSEIERITAELDKDELPAVYGYLASLQEEDDEDFIDTPYEIADTLIGLDKPKIFPEHLIKFITDLYESEIAEGNSKAMNDLGVTGMTVTQVMGCGIQKGAAKMYRGAEVDVLLLPKVKVEVIVSAVPVEKVIEVTKKALYTGNIGDGKIFVSDIENVVKVRTGEEGFAALQGEN